MAIGNLVTASRYNSMRNALLTVLGTNNSGTDGYGQFVVSDAKADTDTVSHQDMVELYIDLYRARVHQTGNPPSWNGGDGLSFPSSGDIIGEFAAAVGATDSSDATTNLGSGYVDFENAIADVQSAASQFSVSQMTQESLISSTRTSTWNGTISHIVTITFPGYTITNPDTTTEAVSGTEHRRYFFNTGGNIQFEASLTGGTSTTVGTKDYTWSQMLSNMGTIIFDSESTAPTGTGTGSALGNTNLTTTYQTIFTKAGSGVYAENDYTIRARSTSGDTVQFEITFNDDDSGDPPITPIPPGGIVGGVDENVQGSTNSFINILYADGDDVTIDGDTYSSVVVPVPTAANNSTL